jgi:hypothetical protein
VQNKNDFICKCPGIIKLEDVMKFSGGQYGAVSASEYFIFPVQAMKS